MEDITPILLEQIQKTFRQNLKDNDKIAELTKKLTKGIATYQEADMYAVEVGQALAKAFAANVSSNTLPGGKMYYNIASRIIPPTLRESCSEIAEFAETIQKGMNERAGLGIKVQKARYNKDKEKGIIEHAAKAEKYDTVKKSTEDALVNMGQATVTDTLKENVEFQYKAGLSPKIIRTAAKGCCKWCDGLAGTYPYEDVSNSGHDVYRRHANCNCIVDYVNEGSRRQNVHSKEWYKEEINARLPGVKRIPQVPASLITAKVRDGRYSLKLSRQNYEKHVEGTERYKIYKDARAKKGLNSPSVLTITYEEAQEIINRQSGTGIIKVRKNGELLGKESITCDRVIGKYMHRGQWYETNKANIVYGKKGSHIYPIKGNDYD